MNGTNGLGDLNGRESAVEITIQSIECLNRKKTAQLPTVRTANGLGRHQTAPRKVSSVPNSAGLRLLTGLCENLWRTNKVISNR